MKKLPHGSIDPNRNLRIPSRRIVDALRRFWPHGHSAPIAVRFAQSDAFKTAGWRIPTKENSTTKKHEPIKIGSPQKLASYVGRYITRDALPKGAFKWRTRITRTLGRNLLRKSLQTLSQKELRTIVRSPLLPLIYLRGA